MVQAAGLRIAGFLLKLVILESNQPGAAVTPIMMGVMVRVVMAGSRVHLSNRPALIPDRPRDVNKGGATKGGEARNAESVG